MQDLVHQYTPQNATCCSRMAKLLHYTFHIIWHFLDCSRHTSQYRFPSVDSYHKNPKVSVHSNQHMFLKWFFGLLGTSSTKDLQDRSSFPIRKPSSKQVIIGAAPVLKFWQFFFANRGALYQEPPLQDIPAISEIHCRCCARIRL